MVFVVVVVSVVVRVFCFLLVANATVRLATVATVVDLSSSLNHHEAMPTQQHRYWYGYYYGYY